MKHKYKKLNAKERKILKTFTKAEWKAVEIGYGLIGLDLPKVVKHWRKLGFTDNNIMDMLSSYKQGQEQGFNLAIKKVQNIKKKLWKHHKTFIGNQQKTCLALDFVEDVIDEELNKLQQEKTK